MKPESMGQPDIYFRRTLHLHMIAGTGVQAWLQSPSKYIKETVKNAEAYDYESRFQKKFPSKGSSLFAANYCKSLLHELLIRRHR
jgi:hypothetical protein